MAQQKDEGADRTAESSMELYVSNDGAVSLPVRFDGDTAWATQAQMAELFGVTAPTVNEHLANAFAEGELDQAATIRDFRIVRSEGSRQVTRSIKHYDLDAIISVGYRVHSPRGVHFRRWATSVLRQRILDQNNARLARAAQLAGLMASSSDQQLASLGRIMQRFVGDLDRLADYDHGVFDFAGESLATERIDNTDVERIVDELRDRYPADERIGVAKDESVHGVLGQIDQTYMGQDLYPTAQEKAANLLYMLVRTTRSVTATNARAPPCSRTSSTGTASTSARRSPATCSPHSPCSPRPATRRRRTRRSPSYAASYPRAEPGPCALQVNSTGELLRPCRRRYTTMAAATAKITNVDTNTATAMT